MDTNYTDALARLDSGVREKAEHALAAMGLSMADAVCLFIERVALDQKMPFEVKQPSARTKAAMDELIAGKAQRFPTLDGLMEDLRSDD